MHTKVTHIFLRTVNKGVLQKVRFQGWRCSTAAEPKLSICETLGCVLRAYTQTHAHPCTPIKFKGKFPKTNAHEFIKTF